MFPLLDRIGPFLIYSYTAVLGLGILAATGITGWLAHKQQIKNWFDAVLVCLIAGLIGGRLGFVLANWIYFQDHTASIAKLWQGGYSYWGALASGIFGLWLWVRLWHRKPLPRHAQNMSFATYTDLLAPGFALLCAFGWLACWFEGCAYGQETTISLFAADLPDEFGIFAVRYQTQMMGLVWSLLIFFFAMLTRSRWHTGQLFWLTLGFLSLGNIGISLLRGDPVPMVNSMRLDVIINGTIVLISAFFVLYSHVTR
ncbi:MAG: prolipoprotein diacylglyceryl transferase [Anaerolineae bacterium]|nr:prolipoprotein diacylglyceryl transferase [Anaerolineae bacterium]